MRKLAIGSLSFAAGVFLAVYFLTRDLMPIAAGVLAIAGIVSCFPFAKGISKKLPVRIVCLAAAAGMLWSWGYNCLFCLPAERLDGVKRTVTATVTDYPEYWRYGHKVDARLLLEGKSIKTKIYYYPDTELLPGDEVSVTAEFSKTDSIGEEETYSVISNGYLLYAFAKNDITVTGHRESAVYFPKTVAKAMGEKMAELFPEDVSAFLKAMLIGDRTDISRDLTAVGAFSNAGVYHIIAVSGLHVSFITSLIYLLLGRKKWTAAVIVPLTFVFMAVTGFTPSVTRAGIMQMLFVTAPLFNRESDSLTSLGGALGVILLFNPYAIAHAGLQMSFLATLGIILLTPGLSVKLIKAAGITRKSERSALRKLRDRVLYFIIVSSATTIGATVLTVPVTALYFGRVSLIAPVSNLLILWIAPFIFVLGLIACAAGFIWMPAASVIAIPLVIAVRYVLWITSVLGSSVFAAVYTSNRYIIFWIVYVYGAGLLFILMKGRFRQLLLLVSSAAVLLCVVLIMTAVATDRTYLNVTALDVGQGECILITAGKYTAAVDCGSSGYNDAGNILADHLLSIGRTRIDAMMLTHYDSDHVNGVDELMERIDVTALFLPEPELCEGDLAQEIISKAEKNRIPIVYVTEDICVSLGDAEMKVFAPVMRGEENDMCVSCLFTRGEYDAFITGDMSMAAERVLLSEKRLPDTEILVAGHHGAESSTSTALLETVTPEAVIISVGANSYGHPSEKVLERINKAGADVYRTDKMGNVTFTFNEVE